MFNWNMAKYKYINLLLSVSTVFFLKYILSTTAWWLTPNLKSLGERLTLQLLKWDCDSELHQAKLYFLVTVDMVRLSFRSCRMLPHKYTINTWPCILHFSLQVSNWDYYSRTYSLNSSQQLPSETLAVQKVNSVMMSGYPVNATIIAFKIDSLH